MNIGILWVVLAKNAKVELLKYTPPMYSVHFAHHVTLFYGIELSEEYRPLIGMAQKIKIKNNCYNDIVQAVEVDINLKSKNTNPHITISAKEGVEPVESNIMLQSEHISIPLPNDIELEGIVEFKEF
jgi:hypothetical protein